MVFSQYSTSSKKRSFGKAKIKSNSQKLPKNISNIEVKIHQLSSKGVGVGYINQQDKEKYEKNKVYVPNTIPGEVVRVYPTKKTGKGLEAELIELVTPSAERQSPKCNAYLNCGGCQLQHMTYDAYLEWKQQTIFNLFQKSNIPLKEFGGFFASKLQQRRRASFKFKRTKEKSFIGFYANKSHQILGCRGVTRSDFKFLNNVFYLLELNTQPGMTNLSLVPEIASYKGLTFNNLVEKILLDASVNR